MAGWARHAQREHRLRKERVRVSNLLSNQNALHYYSLQGPELRGALAASLKKTGLSWKCPQQVQLEQTVGSFLDYFGNPSFDAFLAQRTNGGGFLLEVNKGISNVVTRSGAHQVTNAPSVQELVHTAWDALAAGNRKSGSERLDAIAVQTLALRVIGLTNGYFPINAQRECAFVAGAFQSGFSYFDSPRAEIRGRPHELLSRGVFRGTVRTERPHYAHLRVLVLVRKVPRMAAVQDAF